MKRIAKFLLFKVLEVAGAFIVWWGLSWYGHWICSTVLFIADYDPSIWAMRWLAAPLLGFFFGIACPAIICFVLYRWIKWNWKKAGE